MGLISSSQTHPTNGDQKNRVSCAAVAAALREPFHIITTTLLSLLLPLSFLLLARLSTTHYLLSLSNYNPTRPTSFLSSLFLYTKNPTITPLLVSLISVSCLTHALTGKIKSLRPSSTRYRLYAAWIFLCILQICVGLGIEGSIATGIDGCGFGQENSFLCRVIFFFGLHETMLFWGRTVVKPVVDDTIFGYWRKEGWPEKAAIGLSYGALWWWRLREEAEALVGVPEMKRELMMETGVADFVGWWLYYLTVTIGMVRVVKGLIWTVTILACRRGEGESRPNDDKV
ncbi:hypothetical protein CDL12_11751 [Handroanthus impetiginosus]|uniref:Uncharacterized protein n=1 Tax=Handroanthus impetiginosus TaxID=429701 RepID=A0A2G9HDJ1_9LAMI|nr:hypothetical protein CDL12_11750 [Handroanthus impetiginosus]PIN15607.1 hypothetical protein CDL12_11751 [Handroanthus impetiginosus]